MCEKTHKKQKANVTAKDDKSPGPCRRRRSPEWRKFVVDGRVLDVCPSSRLPKRYIRLTKLKGICVESATREERRTFLRRQK